MRANLQAEGLDFNNVTTWVGRPSRTRKRRAPSYWEEYVETDTWYQRKLIEDVPPEELYAALEDPDLDEDEGEEADGDEEEVYEDEGEEDGDFVVQDIPSDAAENSDAVESDSDSDGDTETTCTDGEVSDDDTGSGEEEEGL